MFSVKTCYFCEVNAVTLYHTISSFNNLEEEAFRKQFLQLFPKQSLVFTALIKVAFENIVRKGENAGSKCFQPFPTEISTFLIHLFCHLQMLSIWSRPKFCYVGKG